MTITYREAVPADYAQVKQLLTHIGWGKRVEDDDRLARMIQGADRNVVACRDERVVGFARALFDGASNGYISTVAVAPDEQRQGIGRELVKRLMHCDHPGQITWVLRSRAESRGFWESLGFTASATAMEIVRRE